MVLSAEIYPSCIWPSQGTAVTLRPAEHKLLVLSCHSTVWRDESVQVTATTPI